MEKARRLPGAEVRSVQRSTSSHPKAGGSQHQGPRGIAGSFGVAGEFSLEKSGWQCSLEGVQVSSGTECKLRSNICVCGSEAVKWFVQNTFCFSSKGADCRFKPQIFLCILNDSL